MTGQAPRYSALKAYDRCVAGMLADPHLSGDLLLIGIAMARRAHYGRDDTSPASAGAMARAVFGQAEDYTCEFMGEVTVSNATALRWHAAMREDIRRYDWKHDPDYRPFTPCGAPTPRKPACGKNATIWSLLTDPQTGRRLQHGACHKHRQWWQETITKNQAELDALDIRPVPPANAGGVLRRHLPTFAWEKYWLKIDPKWVEPPEASPVVPTPPTLRLIISDDDLVEAKPARKTARPHRPLTLLQGEGGDAS